MAAKILPLFVVIYWTIFAFAVRAYYWWSGKPLGRGPTGAMVLLPALILVALLGSIVIADTSPVLGAWIAMLLHILFAFAMARIFVLRKGR